jgi:hypothetical protein
MSNRATTRRLNRFERFMDEEFHDVCPWTFWVIALVAAGKGLNLLHRNYPDLAGENGMIAIVFAVMGLVLYRARRREPRSSERLQPPTPVPYVSLESQPGCNHDPKLRP